MCQGKSADMGEVLRKLNDLGADKDSEGLILWKGSPPVMFMGVGPDCLIREDAHYRLNGEWKPVADLCGGPYVTIIG